MTGIDLFLNKMMYGPEQHISGWDKYVYDEENIHYALLQILSESCPLFAQAFLGVSDTPQKVTAFPKPENGLFDLIFTADNLQFYCEVKVWATLSDSQFNRQLDFLKERNAKGVYVLFTKAADAWSPFDVSERSEGLCHVVGINELMDALEAIGTDTQPEFAELAAAYRKVLTNLKSRW